MEKVLVLSAVKYNDTGEVITGRRHSDAIRVASQLGRYTRTHNSVQGFVDNAGEFYTREEARELASKNGQLPEGHEGELYSEDLWPPSLAQEL